MRNTLITPMYIPRQYITQHYTGFPLKRLGHSWHKPHFYEIFNIFAYLTHISLLHPRFKCIPLEHRLILSGYGLHYCTP